MRYLVTVTTDKEHNVARFKDLSDAIVYMKAISVSGRKYKLYNSGNLVTTIN